MSEEILGFTLGKPHESDDVKWIQVETIKLPRSFLVITSASLPSQPLSKAREKQKKWKITEITLLSIHVCMFFLSSKCGFSTSNETNWLLVASPSNLSKSSAICHDCWGHPQFGRLIIC